MCGVAPGSLLKIQPVLLFCPVVQARVRWRGLAHVSPSARCCGGRGRREASEEVTTDVCFAVWCWTAARRHFSCRPWPYRPWRRADDGQRATCQWGPPGRWYQSAFVN